MARGAVGSDASSRHCASGLRPLPFHMSAGLRRAIYAVCALLWVSGCAWLVVHFAFPTTTDFGPGPNPFEPLLLRLHGWVAVCGVFLFGWITANHISDRWRRAPNRVSGFSLAAFVVNIKPLGRQPPVARNPNQPVYRN